MVRIRFTQLTLIIIFLSASSCRKVNIPDQADNKSNLITEVFCDAENISTDRKYFTTSNPEYLVQVSGILSTEKIRSGMQSVKVNRQAPYGFTLELKNIQPDQYIEASVWRYGSNNGSLVVSDTTAKKLYLVSNRTYATDSAGWQLIKLKFFIPALLDYSKIRLYVTNPDPKDSTDCYFDDYTVRYYSRKQYPRYEESGINILLDSSSFEKLKKKRLLAFENGVLESEDADYVKAKFVVGNDTLSTRVRLKGDWLDHLEGEKWSFRTKVRKNRSWNGMITFSLQTPETRYFLDEWVAHKIFEQEDVLAPRYGFVPVSINERSLGIYAYEEHFAKHLLESRERREGPILKFNEDAFWAKINYQINNDTTLHVPDFKASVIEPFQENRTTRNRELFSQFEVAQDLVFNYKYDLLPLSEIFDIDRTARYFALMDLLRGYHAILWHNQRFYYNPVISKLELIAFDCYTSEGEYKWLDERCIGEYITSHAEYKLDIDLYLNFFKDEQIVDRYIYYLTQYSQSQFIDEFLTTNGEDIDSLEQLLGKEFENYQYDRSFLRENAQNIRNFLSDKSLDLLKKEIVSKANKLYLKSQPEQKIKIRDRNIIANYLQFYRSGKNIVSANYLMETYKILGYSSNNVEIIQKENKNNNIPGHSKNPVLVMKNAGEGIHYVFIKIPGQLKGMPIRIRPWDFPDGKKIYANQRSRSLPPGFKETSDHSLLLSKDLRINKPLIIPADTKLIIREGIKIDLIEGAYILSYSPVFLKGIKEKQIVISSTDGTGRGITVLHAGSVSLFDHVVIDQQSNFKESHWSLTGAVNFYESDVSLTNTVISNNRCEDALNIIRSDYEITSCSFDNIFADGFDSDFSNGIISNSVFRDVGNDAVDLSGGQAFVESVKILSTGDKGISGGEASDVRINNTEISGANLALAAKDLSMVEIDGLKITNCNYGLVSYCKKGEYGPATLRGKDISISDTPEEYLFEMGSIISIDGLSITKYKKNVASLFYAGM